MTLFQEGQTDFAFGELSDEYAASDVEAKKRSLKKARNVRIRNSYAASQRHGSRRMATVSTAGIEAELVTSLGDSLIGFIRAGGIDIYSQAGGLLQSIGGAPWSAAEVMNLTWHVRQDQLFVAHNNHWTRVLTFNPGTALWSLGLYSFDDGAGGSKLQPYYRFADKGVTLQPSGNSGAISVVFSAPVLQAGHVGIRFRYGTNSDTFKELEITGVSDSENGTANVIDTLPPTLSLTVGSSAGYRIGEDVAGQDSKATGVVTDIPDGTHITVLMGSGFDGFDVAGTEYIVGPNTRSKISASGAASPAASAAWDEQVFSPVRGYPGDVFERGGRIGFADFPAISDAILLSAPGFPGIFDVGEGTAADAIFYRLGSPDGERILYGVSASNLVLITTRRVYYVPESDSVPLGADTFNVKEVGGASGGSSCFPIKTDEGVLYVESGGNRVMGVLQTGDVQQPYKLEDLSKRGSQNIKNPVSLAMTSGDSNSPERYVFALNEDGTLSSMFYDTNPARLGWTPWDTDGAYIAMVSILGVIYAICRRVIGGNTTYLLERLDKNAQLDASSFFFSGGTLPVETDSGVLVDDNGASILTDGAALPQFANQTVHVIRGTEYMGEFAVQADGTIPDLMDADGQFEGGLHFEFDMVLWPPEPAEDRSVMFARRRINRAAVRVKETGVYSIQVYGRDVVQTRSAYDQGEDITAPPPLRSEVKRWIMSGYDYEPSIQIRRPLPTPVCVLGVKQEAAGR